MDIKVVKVEPGKKAYIDTIDNSLKSMQDYVGGDIELFRPFTDDVTVICNEEGKICGLPLNRAVYKETTRTVTYEEMKKIFFEAAKSDTYISGRIIFTEDSFDKEYPLESRTYLLTSYNGGYGGFRPDSFGYSIFGTSLDGSDKMVRLERYMAAEHGGKDGWKIDHCEIDSTGEILDIVAGKFFVCAARWEDEDLSSLTDEEIEKYLQMFKFPETFFTVNGKIVAKKIK